MEYVVLIICFIVSFLITPVIKDLAIKMGAVDYPSDRKVHQGVMPRLGGLAIFISMMFGIVILQPQSLAMSSIVLGIVIITITGILDDLFELSPLVKIIGQTLAAASVIFLGDIEMTFLNLPFENTLHLGMLSLPFTFLWIVGITNAINLIDGLDGLAAGVSSIVLVTISILAVNMGYVFVFGMAMILLGSTLGFLVHNFYPAKIFMGDTGAMLLGFMIAVLSLLGFKNVTFISFIVPILVLGVPISDTFFAIVRRLVNKKALSAPDKSHLHHCLLEMGYTHRQAVLVIYGFSALFGVIAILYSQMDTTTSIFLLILLCIAIEYTVEKVGLINKNYKPLIRFMRDVRYSFQKEK